MPSANHLGKTPAQVGHTLFYLALVDPRRFGLEKQPGGKIDYGIVINKSTFEQIVFLQPDIQKLDRPFGHSGTPGSWCTIASRMVRYRLVTSSSISNRLMPTALASLKSRLVSSSIEITSAVAVSGTLAASH